MKTQKTQKTIVNLFVIFISLLMFNCSKDDNKDIPDEIWKVTSVFTENAYDLNADGVATKDLLLESSCTEYYQTLTLRSDNTGIISSSSFLIVYEGEEVDTYESLCFNNQELFTTELTWAKTENTLILTINGETSIGTITGSDVVFNFTEGLPIMDTPEENNVQYWEGVEFIYSLQ